MPERLLREIRKLEVRLEDYLKEEESFVEELRILLNRFKELNEKIESKEVNEAANLRLEAIKALSETLKKEGEAEHEKSHLMESYGNLLLTLEEEFKFIPQKSET